MERDCAVCSMQAQIMNVICIRETIVWFGQKKKKINNENTVDDKYAFIKR